MPTPRPKLRPRIAIRNCLSIHKSTRPSSTASSRATPAPPITSSRIRNARCRHFANCSRFGCCLFGCRHNRQTSKFPPALRSDAARLMFDSQAAPQVFRTLTSAYANPASPASFVQSRNPKAPGPGGHPLPEYRRARFRCFECLAPKGLPSDLTCVKRSQAYPCITGAINYLPHNARG